MAKSAKDLVYNWETVRYELLNTRLCDIPLKIRGSILERKVLRLHRELGTKGLVYRPACYLTDSWGCPDRIPLIGIPFYLADERLGQIEEEQTGDLEDEEEIMMLLRHEAGHAYNYAYRLYEEPRWRRVFGRFDRPYSETFRPDPLSRQFVRHIVSHRFGRTYAQKHPDEDFAETFAVWLTPGAAWRTRYRLWPALAKLRYIDRTMARLRGKKPIDAGGVPPDPVHSMEMLLIQHYGERAERFSSKAQGYVDDILTEIFIPPTVSPAVNAAPVLRVNRRALLYRISHWTGIDEQDIRPLLTKMEQRSRALGLRVAREEVEGKMVEITAVVTTLVMNFAYTGKFLITHT